jgi:acetyl esterase/lipase
MSGCKQLTYKTVGETKLDLFVFSQEKPTKAPAIVFFFGGGWQNGTPQQFEVQCRELAKRGMVAISADYRVASRHGVKPTACVADARSAVRWIRAHADELGIDPDRIASAGGSAGGHIAACTALIHTFDEPTEDRHVSACPNALVLFNPALVLAPLDGYDAKGFGTRVPEDRLGTKPEKLSPAHHVVKHAPPTIIFHGKQDTTVPFDSVVAFTEIMTKLGNRCELKAYDGQSHGFFNNDRFKKETLDQTVAFLVSLGWLAPE